MFGPVPPERRRRLAKLQLPSLVLKITSNIELSEEQDLPQIDKQRALDIAGKAILNIEDYDGDEMEGLLHHTSLAAPGALAHRLQRRAACKIQNGRQWPPKWPTGSGKGSNPRLLAILSNFC